MCSDALGRGGAVAPAPATARPAAKCAFELADFGL